MPRYTSQATIPFPNIAAYLDAILDSLVTHNLQHRAGAHGHDVTSPFGGSARLVPEDGALRLSVAAEDAAAFNRLKHDLTSLIGFVARAEDLQIAWTGDRVGPALPPDLRILAVRAVRDLTPGMRRITFAGTGLERLDSPEQIHCRLLFQARDGGAAEWPQLDDDGRILWPRSGRLATRIYTIRRIDAAAGRLEVDFVMHAGAGPGAAWAANAAPGDSVGILGPAAHGPQPADWYLLAGDETGLPGLARILEGLPSSATGVALVEVANAAEEQEIALPPGITLHWLHRDGAAPGTTDLLARAVRSLDLPPDRKGMFFWGGAEFQAYRAMRGYLLREAGVPAARMVAYSHWRRGMSEEDIAAAGASAISA